MRFSPVWSFLLLISVSCFPPSWRNATAADNALSVATFQADVTLPIGHLLYAKKLATVEHPLLAKGIVLQQNDQRYVLCAVDWCTMHNATHDVFRAKIAAAAKVDACRVAVQCVHQHTAPYYNAGAQQLLDQQENPPAYRDLKFLDEVTDRLAAAVAESLTALEPFDSVGTGSARVDRVASCRRVKNDKGEIWTRWSACTDPALRAMPEEPIDPMLKTVSLARDGQALVRLHYYATHPQSYYRDGRASYDFPGIARQRLQEEEGVFQIYFTGCAGDITAGKYNDGTPAARAGLAERLHAGMAASAASTQLTPVDRIEWTVAPTQFTASNDGDDARARHQAVVEDPGASPEARIKAAAHLAALLRLEQPIEISSLRIGDVRILHLPGEPMLAFQLFAQRTAADSFVAVAGYGQGAPGYICTEAAFDEGGYEPSASAVVPESEAVVEKAIRRVFGVE